MLSLIDFRVFFPQQGTEGNTDPSSSISVQVEDIIAKLKGLKFWVQETECLIVQSGAVSETTELEVAFRAETSFFPEEFAYRMLTSTWEKVASSYGVEKRPLLVILNKKAFIKSYVPCHRDMFYYEFDLGVLPFTGEFVSYAKHLNRCKPDYISFYHDERTAEIIVAIDDLTVMKMVISYNSIIRLLVESKHPYGTVLYFVLLHPALLYIQRFFEKWRRTRDAHFVPPDLIGKANVIRVVIKRDGYSEAIISRLHFRCGQMPVMYGSINYIQAETPPTPDLDFPYFSCRYMFHAIMNHSFYVSEQIRREDRDWKVLPAFSNEKALEKSLTDIFFAVESGCFVNFYKALHSLYKYYSTHAEENSFLHYIVPSHSRYIRRVIITPTRVLLWPPELMFENRVLRNYNPDFALRVYIRDDNISRLPNSAFCTCDIFDFTVKHPLINSLDIGGRLYEFLGWSNSQIRDHGVWMYAKDDKGKTVLDIRQWMGDFSHIHCVAKYMSRMGQAFSQTKETVSVPLQESCVRTDSDIECCSVSGNYYFSDGIGKISVSLAKKVQDALGHDKHCSAFQIRYGGYKGMLVIDPNLKDIGIVFRRSMKKFDSPENTRLEIARTSAPVSLFLNRPFITLLDQLGVKTSVLLRMQENTLRTLTDMLLYEDEAASYLHSRLQLEILKPKDVAKSGIGLTTEPFFRALLLALHRHYVHEVKTKVNIPVDVNKGRNMLGVLDETGELQYGQVFVQYTTDISCGETLEETTIVTGTVLVTKNPCMLPGDVRKFEAVDIPGLHHITDCIVFPQNGPRPHPSEMAGSDLDGDEYVVLWDNDLIFSKANCPPGHFPSISAPEVADIRDEDMVDFLVNYIRNDSIGFIANVHLAMADQEGIFSPHCTSIAEKFSIAVDFPKTGADCSLFRLCSAEKPRKYPDFMEKHNFYQYRSRRALGKMFRVCKDFETENQHASLSYSHIQVDPDLVYPGWEEYRDDAIRSRDKYNSLLSFVLQSHGVYHEAEAFSGAFTRLHCRYYERRDKAEVTKMVVACVKALCKNMKNEFYEGFKEITDAEILKTEIYKKASAWYVVTYQQQNPAFLSFPWIMCNILTNIRLEAHSNAVASVVSPLIMKLDSCIMTCVEKDILPELPPEATEQFQSYNKICDRKIVVSAFRVVLFWAIEMGIVQNPGGRQKGFMYLQTLIKLFTFIAVEEGFLVPGCETSCSEEEKVAQRTAAHLFLAFLKFCVKLRFCNKQDLKNLLPFDVYKHKRLGKNAMNTYHQIAIAGTWTMLHFDREMDVDIYEMKPEYVDCGNNTLLHVDNLQNYEQALKSYAGLEDVSLRVKKNNKKLIVSATGLVQSLHKLKAVIQKGSQAFFEFIESLQST